MHPPMTHPSVLPSVRRPSIHPSVSASIHPSTPIPHTPRSGTQIQDQARESELSHMGRDHLGSSLPVCGTACPMSSEQQRVPDLWRQANVSLVFKKGEKYDAANYRPASLTCICWKTLEQILVSNINKHLSLR